MKGKALRTIVLSSFALVVMPPAAWRAPAQEAKHRIRAGPTGSVLDGAQRRDNASAERCSSIHLAGC